ncbi:hypothetical protein PRIPAC_98013, partial [Pristionchus pacificus]|uniref:Uncharacterized protein n=1 Tax=Pristionchus pacificus TaxID=54126 RepID=A0A2A6B3A1_PRIPA
MFRRARASILSVNCNIRERKSRCIGSDHRSLSMMRSTSIVVCCLFSFSICSDCTTSKWWPNEHAEHECRACKAVTLDKNSNCPSDEYFCDEQQPLRALVLTKDSCHCQSIACANRDWRLAVNGSIVDRIRCDRREWYTIYGEAVPSTVCVKPKPVSSETTTASTTTSIEPSTTSTSTSTPAGLCPEMTKYPVADCNEANPGRTCAEAIITPTSVSCTLPESSLYI